MECAVFRECWHGRFGGAYSNTILTVLILLFGSIVRREMVSQLEDLIQAIDRRDDPVLSAPPTPDTPQTPDVSGSRHVGFLKVAGLKSWDRIRIKRHKYKNIATKRCPKVSYVLDIVRGTVVLNTKVGSCI